MDGIAKRRNRFPAGRFGHLQFLYFANFIRSTGRAAVLVLWSGWLAGWLCPEAVAQQGLALGPEGHWRPATYSAPFQGGPRASGYPQNRGWPGYSPRPQEPGFPVRSEQQALPSTSRLVPPIEEQLGTPTAGPEIGFAAAEAPWPSGQEAPAESALDRAVRQLEESAGPKESPLDQALREFGIVPEGSAPTAPSPSGIASVGPSGGSGPQLKLIDISLDALLAAGTSTADEETLQILQGGGHDPRKRGFTVRGVELSLMGAVDPYLDGEMHLLTFLDPIEGETEVELEEAFFTTRTLPKGLQLKAGHYLTEFGRINPTHPHQWAWLDQPIIHVRVFGPDGMRAPGARLSWLLPVGWFSQLYGGIQNANGETMASFLANEEFFEERAIGGRPFTHRHVHSLGDLVYTARWENSWSTSDDQITWLIGMSGVFGPNATGPDGNTQIYGLDLTRKWRPKQNDRGWPFTIWMAELVVRRYRADQFTGEDPLNPGSQITLPAETLTDWGFYVQWLYGFKPRWAIGLRYEYVWGSGPSLDSDLQPISRQEDPWRDNRHRFSPLLAWYLTEYSRFNFQYNYDHASHLPGKDAHSFWIGAEFMLGSHPAHKF